jgi:hypothetical protein
MVRRTVGPSEKNPPKIRFKKFGKLTGHKYACNSLTNLQYEAQAIAGYGSDILKYLI